MLDNKTIFYINNLVLNKYNNAKNAPSNYVNRSC